MTTKTLLKPIKKMDAMRHRMAVYGTLRKDQYNFKRLPSVKYIATTTLKGYEMWDIGGVPIITRGAKSATIVVDILSMNSEDFDRVADMEISAGYTLGCAHGLGRGCLTLWISAYSGDYYRKNGATQVVSGDWIKYRAILAAKTRLRKSQGCH